jgi:hypothetical protein
LPLLACAAAAGSTAIISSSSSGSLAAIVCCFHQQGSVQLPARQSQHVSDLKQQAAQHTATSIKLPENTNTGATYLPSSRPMHLRAMQLWIGSHAFPSISAHTYTSAATCIPHAACLHLSLACNSQRTLSTS